MDVPRRAKEHLSPHSIALMILVRDYIDLTGRQDHNCWADDLKGKRILNRALLSWVSLPQVPLVEILKVCKQSSELLHSEYTKSIEETTLCLQNELDLETFLDDLHKDIFRGFNHGSSMISKRSLIGLFLRRTYVIYREAGFEDLFSILESLKKYLNPNDESCTSGGGYSMDETREAKAGLLPQTVATVEDMELESHSELDSKSSGDSVETELKSADLKQHRSDTTGWWGDEHMTAMQADNFFLKQVALIEACESQALKPVDLQKKIHKLLDNNPHLTLAHFVSYVNNARIGEYCGAMESLLAYFRCHDKVVRREDKCDKYFGMSNWIERFSTLNLGLMHLKFGHRKAALDAVRMATSHAQLTCDWDCLTYAISYLHYLQADKPDHRLLEEIIEPAIRNRDYDLAYDVVHSSVSRRSTGGCRPRFIFDCLFATDAAFSPHCDNLPTRFAHKACLWNMYGKRCMTQLYCQLELFSRPTTDKISRKNAPTWRAEQAVLAFANLAQLFDEEGNSAAYASVMEHVKLRYPENMKVSKVWKKTEAITNHQNCLRLAKFSEALHWQQVLMNIDQTEATYRNAEYLTARNELSAAKLKINQLLQQDNIGPQLKSKIYLLMSRIHAQASKSDTSSSMRYALQALKLSLQCCLHEQMLQAGIQVAQLMFNCGTDGLSCLRSLHYEMMSNGSSLLQTKYTLMVLKQRIDTETSKRALGGYVKELEDVYEKAQLFQDLDLQRLVLYTLAHLVNDMGPQLNEEQLEQRERFSFEFNLVDQKLATLPPQVLLS